MLLEIEHVFLSDDSSRASLLKLDETNVLVLSKYTERKEERKKSHFCTD